MGLVGEIDKAPINLGSPCFDTYPIVGGQKIGPDSISLQVVHPTISWASSIYSKWCSILPIYMSTARQCLACRSVLSGRRKHMLV